MEDALTITDIVADSSLDTRIISGAEGAGRQVFWAHSCEMPDPSQWLQPHELLMTTGMCVPSDGQAQRRFIAALDEAGLAGITIGEDGLAPPLTEAMMDESQRRGFPILRTGPNTPFVAIGRMVASSNANKQTTDVLRLAKLYRVAAQRDPADRRSAESLKKLFGTDISVVDVATGCVVIGKGHLGPVEARSHALRTLRNARLFLGDDSRLDALSLVHLSQVLEVDANEILQGAIKKISESTAMFESALAGRLQARSALGNLWAGNHGGYRVTATACDVELRVQLALVLATPNTLTTGKDGKQLTAVPESEFEHVKALFGELGLCVGASAVHFDPADLEAAVDEARSEFAAAGANGGNF
jgi:purine catabolism regulator